MRANKGGLTTEQLGQAARETVKQMSPEEKAKLREQIKQSVQKKSSISGDANPTLEFLRAHKLALTRENYLYIAHWGHPPAELDGETKAEIPIEIRRAEARAAKRERLLRMPVSKWRN